MDSLELEYGYDYLYGYIDGPGSEYYWMYTDYGTVGENTLDGSFITTGNELFLYLYSDRSWNYEGFVVSWELYGELKRRILTSTDALDGYCVLWRSSAEMTS